MQNEQNIHYEKERELNDWLCKTHMMMKIIDVCLQNMLLAFYRIAEWIWNLHFPHSLICRRFCHAPLSFLSLPIHLSTFSQPVCTVFQSIIIIVCMQLLVSSRSVRGDRQNFYTNHFFCKIKMTKNHKGPNGIFGQFAGWSNSFFFSFKTLGNQSMIIQYDGFSFHISQSVKCTTYF